MRDLPGAIPGLAMILIFCKNMLYLIGSKHLPAFKVGFSSDPLFRLRQLQTANPYKLHIFGVATQKWFTHKSEKSFHAAFKELQMLGEWYRYDPNTVWLINRFWNVDFCDPNYRFSKRDFRERLKTPKASCSEAYDTFLIQYATHGFGEPSLEIKKRYDQWTRMAIGGVFGYEDESVARTYESAIM